MFKFIANTYINSADQFKVLKNGKSIPEPIGVRVKRVADFKTDNIKAVYIRAAKAASPFSLEADLSGLADGIYRIELYVRLSNGSANSYYSNDFVFKGKPFIVEFEVVSGKVKNSGITDANKIAEGVAVLAKKYYAMQYEVDLLDVTGNGNTLTIAGTDEYQMLTKAELQKYDDACEDPCGTPGFALITDLLTVTDKYTPNDEGFGTYRQAQKDLRLPTAANTRWTKIVPDDYPIPGAYYDQVIIYYCVNRGIMGGDAVGEITTSLTEHVFYIKSDDTNLDGAHYGSLTTTFAGTPGEATATGATGVVPVEALENLQSDGTIKPGASAIDATTVDIPTEVPVTPVAANANANTDALPEDGD